MTLTLPPELERRVASLVLQGAYASTEAVLIDALKALVREQEREQIDSLLEQNAINDKRIEQLLQEAEAGGGYAEMTPEDWEDIEREGLTIIKARKSR